MRPEPKPWRKLHPIRAFMMGLVILYSLYGVVKYARTLLLRGFG